MGTPYDPNNPLHQLIVDEQGIPVPQKYDPEANNGQGGFVVYTGRYSAGDIEDLASLLSAFQNKDFATQTTLAEMQARISNIESMLVNGTAAVQTDISNVTLDTNQSNITIPAEVTLNGSYVEDVQENLSVPAGSVFQIIVSNIEAVKGNIWVRCDRTHSIRVYVETQLPIGVVSEPIALNVEPNWENGAIRYSIDDILPANQVTCRVINNDIINAAQIRIGMAFQR